MMSDSLNKILNRNNIPLDEVEKVVYEYILLSIFEDIVAYLLEDNNRENTMNTLRQFENKEIVVNKLILDITGMKVNESELSTITKWVIAFIEKKSSRIKIQDKEKIKLLENQNYKCKLCKKEIDLYNSEYDHIISWKLVGDELEDNYQMLCKHCNRCKSSSILYRFIMLFKRY